MERLAYYKMLPEMGPPETTDLEIPDGDDSWNVEIKDIPRGRPGSAAGPMPACGTGTRALKIVETIYREVWI